MSFILGITGGIATGKSMVVSYLKELGFPVVDGDVIAREVVAKGSLALAQIQTVFGPEFITAEGELDRTKLGQLIFKEPQQRQALNALLDPFIRQQILAEIAMQQTNPLVVVDVPLMFETNYQQYMDQVAVVYLPEYLQIERLMVRNQLTKEEAQQRIQAQWPIERKKALADLVFDNTQSRKHTKEQVHTWLVQQKFITGDGNAVKKKA
ncbi:MAG: dephospho-CoA kinase [Enterococcus sp.]